MRRRQADASKPTETTASGDPFHRARLRALRRPLYLTLAGLWLERLAQAFWPLGSAILALWAALAFGIAELLTGDAAALGAGVALAGLMALGVIGAIRFRRPSMAEAIRRLDASLPGRPIATLTDVPAVGASDPAARAVWEAHLARMEAAAAAARAVPPAPALARRDPYALRLAAATAFAVALLFGGAQSLGLRDLPLAGASRAAMAGPVFEAWIEPPAYTGKPSLYLNDLTDRASLEVPEGSRVTVRLYGQEGAFSVEQTLADPAPGESETDWSRHDVTVTRSGALRIAGPRGAEQLWWIEMIPDLAPKVVVAGEVERTVAGQMRLPYAAEDDYGVVSGVAEMVLDLEAVDRRHGLAPAPEPREAVEIDLPMPFRGNRAEFEDVLVEDFSEHPWAGLPVRLTLEVEDAIGQTGSSGPVTLHLPGRRFLDPLAAAIAEQRRDLLWSRENGARVARILRAVSHRPEQMPEGAAFPERPYLMLRVTLRQLERAVDAGLAAEERDAIAEALWQIALLIEDGDLASAAERLRRAQDRLAEALRQGASEQEIAELTDELRRAMQDYMREMARQAERNPDREQAGNGESMEITPDQLQAMLDRIEELAREGRTEEAMALLEQLRQMMENLQFAEGQPGQGGEGAGQGMGEQGLEGLQDTLRSQRELSDESFRGLQQQGQRGEGGREQGAPGPGQRGEGQGMAPRPRPPAGEGTGPGEELSPQELARRQQALRDLLEQQRRGLDGHSGRETGEALERAERSMDAARDALREGDLGRALDEQADAIDALRDGIRSLAEDIARQQREAPGESGDPRAAERGGAGMDPLGRQMGRDGRLGDRDGMVPDLDSQRRARELQEEIRRRSGERSRPEAERDYLRRLLERF